MIDTGRWFGEMRKSLWEGGPSSFRRMRVRNVSGYILALMVVPFMG